MSNNCYVEMKSGMLSRVLWWELYVYMYIAGGVGGGEGTDGR
jgi:hypothetical protein